MAIFSWFLNGITFLFHCVLQCFRLVLFMDRPRKQLNPSIASSSSSSSSSSSDFTPPSSSQSWKYDVFLSFRGTDTRNTFVDHLYTTLVQQGISTFKDDEELRRGEIIRPSLLKAIEESQIAVIVFSENYAESSWCLQELEHIMKCNQLKRDHIVIPIFYHVDPSEVRKHKRNYGEALAKHESENKNVESWRKVLVEAGHLSGFVANGPDTIFIKNIVKAILERLCVAIPSDNEDFIGMEDRLQDLKSKMAIDSEGVLMVGIWGLGGGGKTTLARALCDQISTKFDGCCFMDNIREESRRQGLKELQKEILSYILKQKKEEIDGYGDVRNLIKVRLRRKKVLLVLDDVDDANQLEALAGSHDWFNQGSRIIITTRDQHLLNIHQVNVIHDISMLNNDEAMKLFRKHAHNHIQDFDGLSVEVVSYACGLPLALKVIGSLLCDKDKSQWRSALARLKDIPENDILEKLKISYDGLKPLEKELFLDIACFFRGPVLYPIKPWVVLEACGFHPKIGVRALIEKALITVSEKGEFDMHDLIQEMGHYIVREKYPQNPEKHSRVWQEADVVKICATPMEENQWIEALPAMDYSGLHNYNLPHNFPHVVANMKKLRWIICPEYPATSFPTNFQSTKLCYLHLEDSRLEQLWEGYQYLPYLKLLDLGLSKNLISTPDFDGLPLLERIILRYCMKLTYIHPSISHHERLIYVDMHSCTELKVFPPISGMKKLENLLLSGCSQLCEFPEIQRNMDNMVELSMKGTGIKVVPSSIGKYCTNLLSLDFRGCGSLESIEGNFHLLKHLKEFYIESNIFQQVVKIPAEALFDVNCCLEVLCLNYTSFKNLHPRIVSTNFLCFPPSLRKLSLQECNWINEDTACVLYGLSNLQQLDLSYNTFSLLNCSLLQLSSLKFLNLSSCKNLVELPDLPASIAFLKAKGCNSLTIADLPTDLKWLYRISLPMESVSGDGEREVQSMLQGNAINDYSISLCFYSSTPMPATEFAFRTSMLDLPRNWYNDFSGFLISIEVKLFNILSYVITIKDVMGRKNEDVLESEVSEYDGSLEKSWDRMCYIYIPFGSLKHTSWCKSTHTTISFSIQGYAWIKKVELVPGRSKGDSIERVKDTANSSGSRDKEPTEIIQVSKTCIKIRLDHDNYRLQSPFNNFD